MRNGGDDLVDVRAVRAAAARQATRVTPGICDIAAYREAQVADTSHRDLLGPLLPGSGASGVVARRGVVIAAWGDPAVPEMLFSATKSLVSLVAGLAFDDGMLRPHTAVLDTVTRPALTAAGIDGITWHHLAPPAEPDERVAGRAVGPPDRRRRAERGCARRGRGLGVRLQR